MHSTDTELKSKQKQKRKRSLSFNSGSRTSMSSEIKRHSFRVSLVGNCQIIGRNNNINININTIAVQILLPNKYRGRCGEPQSGDRF